MIVGRTWMDGVGLMWVGVYRAVYVCVCGDSTTVLAKKR